MSKIAVTGVGVVSPLGCDPDTLWNNLIRGVSGIERIPGFADLPVTFGGPAKGFNPEKYLEGKELRHLDRYARMALVAGLDACQFAGLEKNTYAPERIGVVIGSGSGGMETIESQIINFHERGPRRISPLAVPMFIVNMASGVVAMHLGAKGPGFCAASACATGGHALATAVRFIQAGDADCMLAGGMEACLTPFSVSAFAAMRALSTRNDDPARASRPFDRDRDGFVMAEGGAVLVLERYSAARARGAQILGVIEGLGMSQDAYHMVAPDPEAGAVSYAIRRAIENAGISPEDVGYINAHGTSTLLNDKVETLAVKNVFGDHARRLRMSSTKSMTGHMIGGTAALETVICMLAMNRGMLPPTINIENQDAECDLDCIAGEAVRADVSYSLNNAFGFGGQNVALVIGKGEI